MHRAGLVDVEEKAIRMDGEVRKIAESVPRFLETIDQIQQQIDGTRKAIHRIEDELDDIRARLESSPREEVSRLERQRESILDQIRQLTEEYGAIQQKIRDISERLAELEGLIKRHQAHEEKQDILQRQIAAAQEAVDRIAQTRERLEESFRERLTQKIRGLFDEISPTPYVPELTPDYDLRLLNSAGGAPVPVAASEGESQILSLAFIGSIITLAREYQAKQEHLPGPESSSYPLVMDSPFGKLGPTYRMQIAQHIPALADQVVVMVTDTQWRGEVDEAMKSRRGHSYVLTYFTPRHEVADEAIKIDGQNFELVKTSPNEFEYTEIREVSHG
jgi:DNA sulfur modification protein DndD